MTDQIRLEESAGEGKALGSKGRYRAKLIAADTWGSTAYYSSEALQRVAHKFQPGIQIYEDHPTETEEMERPERSLSKLVGKILTEAQFDPIGEDGPGLYTDVEFYPSYIERIAELKEDVGLSIRADGLTEYGERAGRVGPVLVDISRVNSVDVVTKAGVGGKLTRILESDRGPAGQPVEKESHAVANVTKEEFEEFKTQISEQLKAIPDQVKEAVAASTAQAVTPGTEQETLPDPLARAKEGHNVEQPATATHTAGGAGVEVVPLPEPEKVVEALRLNDLPAEATKGIYADLKEGKTLDEAIQSQVKLREAYIGSASETGTVHLRESDKGEDAIANAVTRLGAGQRTSKIRG